MSKRCSKFRPGISHTQSDRWGHQQGILGREPVQKSGGAGIGILRSVFEGEDSLQLAVHGHSVQSWERKLAGTGRDGDSQPACGWVRGGNQETCPHRRVASA